VDGIFPALLEKGWEAVIQYLVRIVHACLSIRYVPGMWRQVKVVVIPKPGRNSYSGPKDYTPISLTSFLLKTMERLVDRYLRDEALDLMPLQPNKHTFQAGKSVGTALHQLAVRSEKVLDQPQLLLTSEDQTHATLSTGLAAIPQNSDVECVWQGGVT